MHASLTRLPRSLTAIRGGRAPIGYLRATRYLIGKQAATLYNRNPMADFDPHCGPLPSADDLRRAVTIYLATAYPQEAPPAVDRFAMPAGADVGEWLMSDIVERSPDDAGRLGSVRSFSLRIGNRMYPNMKLRVSRPPSGCCAVFHVDAHDAMLKAPPGSGDESCLQELKAYNAELTSQITETWEQAGLLTERTYLRQAIEDCRRDGAIETSRHDD